MNSTFRILPIRALPLLLLFVVAKLGDGISQEKAALDTERERLLAAAREIMATARYCALITVDASGHPVARAMDPFPPGRDMVVWLGTNSRSRKVQHIRKDPRVSLFYFDKEASGYVTIIGRARLVDDSEEKARWWKDEWEAFYHDRKDNYLLVAVSPEKLEIVSAKHNISGEKETWTPPSVVFKPGESGKQR